MFWAGNVRPVAGFILVAHRGVPSQLPEHTFAGYDLAIAAGAEWIEVDLVAAGDSSLVVSHDLNLQREAGVPAAISSLSLAQIKGVQRLCGEEYYTLAEVFARYGSTVNYLLDLKLLTDPAGQLAALLALLEDYGLAEQVLVESFHLEYLQAIQAQTQAVRLVYLVGLEEGDFAQQIVQGKGFFGIGLEYSKLTRETAEAIRRQGQRAYVYFADETPWKLRRCLALGVDGVITDYAPENIARLRAASNPLRWLF